MRLGAINKFHHLSVLLSSRHVYGVGLFHRRNQLYKVSESTSVACAR